MFRKGFLSMFMLVLMVLLMFGGCSKGISPAPKPQEVLITVKADAPTNVNVGDTVQKMMPMKNPGPELSNLSFIDQNVGYIKLWGGLSSYDSASLWNDLLIFEKVYKVKSISVYISSGGGSAFTGLSLADEIERISATIPVTTYASGIIASAAVPIYASGSKRISSKGTLFMVHPASSFKMFVEETEKDLSVQQTMFKLLKAKYIEKLVRHSKSSDAEWIKRESETTWFDAVQAKAWGLVDEIQ